MYLDLTAGPQRPDRIPEKTPNKISDKISKDILNKIS
jgi:hypothetical protein